jgi:RecB family exonuclease
VEKEFSFIFENNKIAGRFDWVGEDKDGVVIMDFKTSQVKEQDEADKRAGESMQLALYSLAYSNIYGQMPKKVGLHFLESGLVGFCSMDDEAIDKIASRIREASCGIRSGHFEARPNYMGCTYCAYNQICPSAIGR